MRPPNQEPRTADEFHRRGLQRLRAGDRAGAIRDLSQAVGLAPALLEAYQARGDAYRQSKQHRLAVEDYTRVIEGEPDAVDSYVGRAKSLAKLGELDRALADFDRALEMFPDPAVYLERGDLHRARGDDERGIADLTRSIELNGPVRARLHRGIALARLKRFEEAVADQNAVLASDPSPDERCWALVERGDAQAGLGRHDEAIQDFDAALALPVNVAYIHLQALMNRAWAYQDTGRLHRAIEDFDEILRRQPDHRGAHGFRAEVHGKLGDWEAALADHRKQAERTPDNPRAWGWLAWLRAACPDASLRDGAEALVNAQRACELTGGADHDAHGALAAAHAECGRFDEAVAAGTRALELAPENQKAELRAQLELYRAGQPFRIKPENPGRH
jgi:tetratricopeptide (TPR) repeat protein